MRELLDRLPLTREQRPLALAIAIGCLGLLWTFVCCGGCFFLWWRQPGLDKRAVVDAAPAAQSDRVRNDRPTRLADLPAEAAAEVERIVPPSDWRSRPMAGTTAEASEEAAHWRRQTWDAASQVAQGRRREWQQADFDARYVACRIAARVMRPGSAEHEIGAEATWLYAFIDSLYASELDANRLSFCEAAWRADGGRRLIGQ